MDLGLIDSASFTAEQEVPLVPVQVVSRPALLQQISGPGNGTMFRLESDRMVIGRNPDADILVQSWALSRHHVRLDRYQGGYRAVDLDSSNGVYLNEIRIHSAALRDGDTLQLGNAAFVYHEGQ